MSYHNQRTATSVNVQQIEYRPPITNKLQINSLAYKLWPEVLRRWTGRISSTCEFILRFLSPCFITVFIVFFLSFFMLYSSHLHISLVFFSFPCSLLSSFKLFSFCFVYLSLFHRSVRFILLSSYALPLIFQPFFLCLFLYLRPSFFLCLFLYLHPF